MIGVIQFYFSKLVIYLMLEGKSIVLPSYILIFSLNV